MIPVKLSLRNFMCYRDNVPPLYFDGIHTVCISGDNGNGKSALIDAMTWAIWGEARAKSDDDLIHQGQNDMEVEFDFRFGEQLYRIIRKRSRPRRHGAAGQSILEFQIATTADGFSPISGSTIAETQKKITGLLHMDYDTFTNSAFLRQGHADQFTRQSPAKRKEVLAGILGLSFYDQLEERVKGLMRQKELEMAQLDSTIRNISDELTQKPAYEARFAEASFELALMDEAVKEHDSRLSRLRQERGSLENKRQQLVELEGHVAGTKRDIEQWDRQSEQHRSRIKEYEALIGQRSDIEEGYARLLEARKRRDELDRKLRQSALLDSRKHQLEMAVAQAQSGLITEHKLIQRKIEDLEARAQKLPQHKDELQSVKAQLRQLADQEEMLRTRKENWQELQTQLNYLESSRNRLQQEIAEIEDKLKMLFSQREARCPLCETELGADGIKLVENKYITERDHKRETMKAAQSEMANKKAEVESLQEETNRLEQQLNQSRSSAQGRLELLKARIDEAEAAGSQLDEEREKREILEARLARKDFAIAQQQALAELEVEVARLDYDPRQHEEVRSLLSELERYEDSRRRLEEAERLIGQEKEAAGRAEEASLELRQRLDMQNQKRQELIRELESLPRLENDLKQAQSDYQQAVAKQKEFQQTVGSLKAMLERLSQQEEKKKEKEKQLLQSSKEEDIYRELAQVFGKKGIQAMLIEQAIPEIEAEANALLARMTDNRMHLKFETQKETKKGDAVETLDITITDELGTRNYEMFSGGEAFRIDFAIRIALSKLLARRTGAPLRTLIIDEGFGTQDSTGIERMKEAINSIQDDFDKMLVITHIEELRDAFPSRIQVVKTAQGSTIEVN